MKHLYFTAATVALLAPAPSSVSAEDIEFWYGQGGRVEEAIQAQCEAFNEIQTDHSITCIGQGSYNEAMQKSIAAYRSGQHPVLVQFFDAGTLDLMLSDAVLPVAEVMPDANWDDYINGVKSYYQTSTGDLFSQPYNGSTLVFYTRKDVLESVGVMSPPSTWEEVEATAELLKDAGHACPFTTDGHPWRVLEQFAARHGVPIATNNNGYAGLDAEYTFNQGLTADHLNNLVSWREDGLVRLNQDTDAGRYVAAFNAGECAMMEASTGSYKNAFDAHGENLTVSLAPMYEGVERRNTLIGGGSIWVMKGHDEAELDAARAFLTFIRDHDQQISFTEGTGYMPVTQSALDELVSRGLNTELAFATVETGVASLNQPGTADSQGIRLGFYVQFRDIFKEETEAAFNGDKTMQEALDSAAARGDELLRRFEQTYAGVTLP